MDIACNEKITESCVRMYLTKQWRIRASTTSPARGSVCFDTNHHRQEAPLSGVTEV